MKLKKWQFVKGYTRNKQQNYDSGLENLDLSSHADLQGYILFSNPNGRLTNVSSEWLLHLHLTSVSVVLL